tara:strand:+ start:89 stop:373 length:285 start_codon:yes stop_codon:yes gene_type:complete
MARRVSAQSGHGTQKRQSSGVNLWLPIVSGTGSGMSSKMITGNRNDAKKKPLKKEGHQSKANLFNFILFKNYDGTVTSKVIPRETYKELFAENK